MLVIGKITGTHGIKGDIKVWPLTDYPERYKSMTQVYIGNERDYQPFEIESVKPHKNVYIFKFKNITDMNKALELKNKFLLIEETEAVKLPEETYFLHHIIGLEVYLDGEKYLGKVKDIIATGSNDVYVVEGENGEILIPALKEIIKIDLDNQRIDVKNMPGLISDAEEV